MAATSSPRPPPPRSARAPSISTTPPLSGSLAKGATARSAVSPRFSSALKSPTRESFSRGGTPPNGFHTREDLADSLMRETEEKEQLLVQLQNKERSVTELTAENDHLSSAVNAAEGRLAELYADQTRQEEEMAARIEVIEKLRIQTRELEKEKRDVQKMYNEQTATFEAERQAFYDNEQHLKSRIQSLSQALAASRKASYPTAPSEVALSEAESETEVEEEDENKADEPVNGKAANYDETEEEPAEVTSLKLELSTLSTSYASLQGTLMLLQGQLVDLKRVNRELQEENESYMILLREKTLSGQFDVMRTVGTEGSSDGDDEDEDGEDDDEDAEDTTDHSLSTGRTPLDPVKEQDHELEQEQEGGEDKAFEHDYDRDLADELSRAEAEEQSGGRGQRPGGRHNRKHSDSHLPDGQRGESLAGLPLTGPGLDLAAELGRAENKDILDGDGYGAGDKPQLTVPKSPAKRNRKSAGGARSVSVSSAGVLELRSSANDLDALRNEVKSLKDANKALSLYASRIIDRIIAQEGFEHVLAVDYEKTPTSPTTGEPKSPITAKPPPEKKARPQTTFFGRAVSPPATPSPSDPKDSTTSPPGSPPLSGASGSADARRNRRSLSFDWRSFSVFGSAEKKPEPSNLKPLQLGNGSVTGARKLDTQEDDDDRRERERLNATMKLMGIEKPESPVTPMVKSISTPGASTDIPRPSVPVRSNSVASTSRWSLFRSRSTANSETSSLHSAPSGPGTPQGQGQVGSLTQAALEQAEAQEKLAALDAHEKSISAELAKGGGSGFTELAPRRSKGGRRSLAGSGSTVWSAGMSKNGHEEDD